MDYPAHLERRHRLADGRHVLVRPVRRDDERLDAAFLASLSPEARRLRFQRWRGALAEMARFHTRIDYDRHMVLVAEAEGRIVGEAQYVANPGGRSCELGIVVAEDWHHSGLAQRLMQALIAAARARGFESLEGLVLRENAGMLDFVRELGFRVEPAAEDEGLVRIALPIDPGQSRPGARRDHAAMALTPRQIAELTGLIARRRNALVSELQRDAGKARDESYGELAGAAPDAGDESVAALLADLDQSELSRDLEELRGLEAARTRLADGSYGTCADCGADIGFERLKAEPGARRCIACQTLHEKTFAGAGRPTL
jgi:RNA polymerase-binding transcription factor DksA/GNAT superfamily N-acetyltransferase